MIFIMIDDSDFYIGILNIVPLVDIDITTNI